MEKKKVNLFVYGSLRDRKIFESVSGFNFTRTVSRVNQQRLFAEPALLSGYRKVSPDNVYFYAIAGRSSRIDGLLIHDVSAEAMSEIDRYEGYRYQKQKVLVNTAKGPIVAVAYLVSRESMKKHFGDRYHVNLIHELWLRKRIEKFMRKRTRPGERTADAEMERRAERELLATTERDLVITHYHSDAVSDYYLKRELDRPRPSISHLHNDSEAQPFIDNYIRLVVKQVVLNQLDERIQSRYRFALEHLRSSERYFKRSISLLIALQIMNRNEKTVGMIVDKCPETMPYAEHDLVDYVKYAVSAAKSLFDTRVVESHLERIRSNFEPGLVPLGAEVELSNIGAAAVEPQRSIQKKTDPVYDNFKYFHDFQLDVLSWKLGGYIDDHSGSTEPGRKCGFLELAPGRLNIAGEISRPVTAAPWLLNQLIRETTNFYGVLPHSLHLSFQLRKNQVGKQNLLPLGFVKCLLALGGGLEQRQSGRLWVSRMGYDEITQTSYGEELVFARTSRRRWYLGGDQFGDKAPVQATTYVHQYKFIRLDRRANYEPLIMCLKGLQLACNPADYLSAEQLQRSSRLRSQYEELKHWALKPEPISSRTIAKFIKVIEEGLMNEGYHKPVHKPHYISWVLAAADVQLRLFNNQLKGAN